MRLKPTTRYQILRIVPFGLIWLLLGLLYSILEKGIIGDLEYYPSTFNPYSFRSSLLSSFLVAGMIGLILGVMEIRLLNRKFEGLTRSTRILVKSIIYLFAIVLFLVVLTFMGNSIVEGTHIFDPVVRDNLAAFAGNFAFLSLIIYLMFGVVLTLFYTEISMSVGPGVLSNFFTAKYHEPVEEDRIFMFLDMKSSTTIAEKLGHKRYFRMLKQYYRDISAPVVDHRGQVYQYVGDEMVLTWLVSNSKRNADCLRCFFAMRDSLSARADYYHKTYGLAPTFKAGIHCGGVTTGEIGVIKRDIIFTGDVLNSAARIQGLCNTYQSDLLVSADLLEAMDLPPDVKFQSVGSVALRGRDEEMKVLALSRS